jgi:hypothetical protein
MLRLLRAHRSLSLIATLFLLSVLFTAIAGVLDAAACDICALHSSNVLDPHRRGWSALMTEQFSSFNTYENAGDRSLPVNEWIQSSTTTLVVGYGLAAIPLRLEVSVPFINREFRRLKDARVDRDALTGLGDIALVARYTPVDRILTDDSLVRLELFAGFELPTGSTDELDDEEDDDEDPSFDRDSSGTAHLPKPRHGGDAGPTGVHDEDLALGSGSLDFLVGANAFSTYRRLFAAAGFQYSVRGHGDHGYDYANDLTFHLGLGGYLSTHEPVNLALEVRLAGETKGNDSQRHETVTGSGITALYLGPNLHGTFDDRLRGALGVQFPVLQNVSELQLVVDYRILASVAWQF